jgi:hypothetical protein
MARKLTAKSSIIYQGPSLIDGSPIVVIAKVSKSRNSKTGAMVQTYIIRSDMSPLEASKTGLDYAICGNCKHRGTPSTLAKHKQAIKRSCYVVLGQGPQGIYKGFMRGIYPVASGHDAIAYLGAGRMVRIGTYGDGAAVPSHIWDSLISQAKGRTGYTHQTGMTGAAVRPDITMISADTLTEAEAAWAAGNRTFRVIKDVSEIVKGREISCPASAEAGFKTTCMDCGLCAGNTVKAKSIAIIDHGPQNRKRLVINRVGAIAA